MKIQIFDTLFDLFTEKKFYLLEDTMNLFGNLKRSKKEKQLNTGISKKGFL